jgi:DNA-binding transcriptional MerR regulator
MAKLGDTVSDFLEAHRPEQGGEVYGIAELAREFDVTARALRLYEEKGLLSPRRLGSTRIYGRRDRAFLDLYGQHGEGRKQQLEFVVGRTAAAIQQLETKRSEIERSLRELRIIHESAHRQLREKRTK